MTTQYVELFGSRSLSRGRDSFTASRTFLVYEDTDSLLSIEDAINYVDGIFFSETHPDIDGIYANGFSISASGDRANTWEVSWTYAEPKDETDAGGIDDVHDGQTNNTDITPDDSGDFDEPTDGSSGDDGVGEDGVGDDDSGDEERLFTGYSINTTIALVDAWESNFPFPSAGAQGGDSGYEITGGTVVHKGGEPITATVPTATIAISETVTASTFYLHDTQSLAGKRNSNSFYGFDTGTVLFTGVSVQRQTENTWDVTYNFAWDSWFHMRMIPNRNTEGTIEYEADGTTLLVYLKQPFPELISFGFSP